MKRTSRLAFLLLALFAILSLGGCVSFPFSEEGLVVGNNFRLASGEVLDDDLTIVGGNAVLEEASRVNGDVAVIGGNLRVDGEVNGDVSVMGGSVELQENAVVRGSVNQLGGTIDQHEEARVEGGSGFNRGPFDMPSMRTPRFNIDFSPITDIMLAFLRAFALAALAILVTLFAPTPLERVGQAALSQPAISGGIGLLTTVVVPALMLLLGITIILLPLSLLGLIVLGLAILFGWLALGMITGRQISRWLNQRWSDPVNAGVGTITLSLVASMANVIPCVGWIVGFIISVIGLGAVVVTRFGTQFYTSGGSGPFGPRATGPYTPPPAPAEPVVNPPSVNRDGETFEPITPETPAASYDVTETDQTEEESRRRDEDRPIDPGL